MSKQVVGSIPEFTPDSPSEVQQGVEVVADSATKAGEQPLPEEKVTPSEPPAELKPALEPQAQSEDTNLNEQQSALLREIGGLEQAKKTLISELEDLRGQKREAKKAEIAEVQEKLDDLKDIHPNDVATIDRVLHAKGYVSRDGVEKMLYDARKQDEIQRFFKEFPEYSEDNDPGRIKFGPLLQEVALYKEPKDPQQWGVILRRAHKTLAGTQSAGGQSSELRKRQVQVAGLGGGGAQRSSSTKSFSQLHKNALLSGGWSEEEITRMEKNQS